MVEEHVRDRLISTQATQEETVRYPAGCARAPQARSSETRRIPTGVGARNSVVMVDLRERSPTLG